REEKVLPPLPKAPGPQGNQVSRGRRKLSRMDLPPLGEGVLQRGVGLTADQRSPKPRVGVRIPPPLPNTQQKTGRIRLEGLFMAADVKVWVSETRDYFNDLKLEMRRVTWPGRKQVEATTAVVIFSVFAFAAYFAVVDSLLTKGTKAILDVF